MKMTLLFAVGIAFAFPATQLSAQTGEKIEISNPGFEEGFSGWDNSKDNGLTIIDDSAAHSGKSGVHVMDNDPAKGSSLASQKFAVHEGEKFVLRFWGRNVFGAGTKVYLQFLNAQGQKITDTVDPENPELHRNIIAVSVGSKNLDWKQYSLQGQAPEGAAQGYVWIHTPINGQAEAHIDDIELIRIK